MAVMSLGAALAGGALLVELGGPSGAWQEFKLAWREPLTGRYIRVSLGLLGACVLSLLVAWFAPLGWGGRQVQPLFGELGKAWYFFWPIFFGIGLKRIGEGGRVWVLRIWLLVFLLMALIGVFQYFTGWPRSQPIPGNDGRFHATLFLGHHLSVASILIFPFFASLDLLSRDLLSRDLLSRQPSIGRARRVLPPGVLLLCIVAGFSALFLSYSRTLWIALPLGMVLWALRALPRRQVIGTLLLLGCVGGVVSQVPSIQNRARNSMGISDRQILWKANLEFLRERPLTGTGFRRNIEASALYLESLPNAGSVFTGHAHNNFIDVLGGTGLIGAVAWLLWCGVVFLILAKSMGSVTASGGATFVWGTVCAWIVFHLNGLTQVNFWEGKVMHQMMFSLAWAMVWATQPREQES